MPPSKLRSPSVFVLAASFLACGLVPLPPLPLAAAEAKIQAASKAAAALDVANTYAVIVGVLKWEDKSLATYPTADRKDRELYDTLRKRGVPAGHMALLLDDKATLANIRKALQASAEQAKPQSTFIFYYAGHGWRTATGATEFANYDYHSGQAGKPAFAISEIGAILQRKFKGRRVLLFADCCHSGGLEDVARSLGKAKFQAAALTSAAPLCRSTNNWTFTQTLVDGLKGDPLLDGNGDGTITLGELAREVDRAMQFRERQRYGYATAGLAPAFRLAVTDRRKKLPGPIQGPFALKEYVKAREGNNQRTGRIVGFQDGKYAVEFFNYSDKQVVRLPASALSKIEYRTYKVGETVLVARAGLPKAKILEAAGAFHRVRFPAHPAWGEEWLLADQIVQDPRSAAEVEWKGSWFPATVLKTEKDRYFIHYLDYDNSWNEWVPGKRIRFPWKKANTRNPFGVADVPEPHGKDVKDFAARTKLLGGDQDRNAQQWVAKATAGQAGSLDGDWSGRWTGGSGSARIKVVKNRVYILYTERKGNLPAVVWLVETIREGKNRLVGRWLQVDKPKETGPFVGLIVNDERIDGTWGGGARWDFRRQLAKQRSFNSGR